jgi:hypothetical protein
MSPFFTIPTALLPDDVNVLNGWKISKEGIVLTPTGVETKGTMTSDSSYIVMIPKKNGVVTHIRVAELVSKTFQPNLHNIDTVIYHLDEDTQNNHLDNLKPMKNNEYLQYRAKREAMKMMVQVDQFDLSGKLIQTFDSCRAAKLAIGDDKSDLALSRCIRDGNGHYKGFVFKLKIERV